MNLITKKRTAAVSCAKDIRALLEKTKKIVKENALKVTISTETPAFLQPTWPFWYRVTICHSALTNMGETQDAYQISYSCHYGYNGTISNITFNEIPPYSQINKQFNEAFAVFGEIAKSTFKEKRLTEEA